MRPGEPQTSVAALAVVVRLMTEAGPVDRAALLAEVAEDGRHAEADLDQLVRDRFVEHAGDGTVELSDRGWQWIGQELTERPDESLTEDLPEDTQLEIGALYAVMNVLGRYLTAADLSLGDFVLISQGRMAPPTRP